MTMTRKPRYKVGPLVFFHIGFSESIHMSIRKENSKVIGYLSPLFSLKLDKVKKL